MCTPLHKKNNKVYPLRGSEEYPLQGSEGYPTIHAYPRRGFRGYPIKCGTKNIQHIPINNDLIYPIKIIKVNDKI